MSTDEFLANDNTTRKIHYGLGRQPWDDIVDAGWAPEFAASNVVKYLRRDKELNHSLKSARWYYDKLDNMSRAEIMSRRAAVHAQSVLVKLQSILTQRELDLVTNV